MADGRQDGEAREIPSRPAPAPDEATRGLEEMRAETERLRRRCDALLDAMADGVDRGSFLKIMKYLCRRQRRAEESLELLWDAVARQSRRERELIGLIRHLAVAAGLPVPDQLRRFKATRLGRDGTPRPSEMP